MEIEGLELAIGSALDILYAMLSNFSKVSFEFSYDCNTRGLLHSKWWNEVTHHVIGTLVNRGTIVSLLSACLSSFYYCYLMLQVWVIPAQVNRRLLYLLSSIVFVSFLQVHITSYCFQIFIHWFYAYVVYSV